MNIEEIIRLNTSYALESDLHFKEKFPLIETELFLLKNGSVKIKPNFNPFATFAEFEKFYSSSIRFLGCTSQIIEDEPAEYVKKIEARSYKNPYTKESLLLNEEQFYNIILARFSEIEDLNMSRLTSDFSRTLQCKINSNVSEEKLEKDIRKFLKDLGPRYSHVEYVINFTKDNLERVNTIAGNLDVNALYPNQLIKRWTEIDLQYIKNDDQYWFENDEKIYDGKISKAEILKKFGIDNKLTKIVVDCSVFNTVDLRFLLALYDQIYLALPLNAAQFSETFFQYNQTDRNDLLYLVKENRLKFLVMQPESRIDSKLLQDAYLINPKSIISKRAINIVVAAHLVDLNKNFLFYQKEFEGSKIIKDLREIGKCTKMVESDKILMKMFANQIALPKKMLLSHARFSHSTSPFIAGIEDDITEALSFLNLDQNEEKVKAFQFEILVNRNISLIANSLGAFLAPRISLDRKYSTAGCDSLIGWHLSQLKQLHVDYCDFDKDSEIQKAKQMAKFHDIPVFCGISPNRGTPSLKEFNERLPKSYSKKSLNNLIMDLVSSTPEEAKDKIRQYSTSMNEILDRDSKFNNIKFKTVMGVTGLIAHLKIFPLLTFGGCLTKQYKKDDPSHTLAKVNHCIFLNQNTN